MASRRKLFTRELSIPRLPQKSKSARVLYCFVFVLCSIALLCCVLSNKFCLISTSIASSIHPNSHRTRIVLHMLSPTCGCCGWDRQHIVVIYEHASRYVRCARRDTADDVVCMPVPRSAPVIVVVNVGDARRRRDHGVDSIELTLTAADRDDAY